MAYNLLRLIGSGSIKSIDIPDLDPNNNYKFRIRAKNTEGVSDWSNIVELGAEPQATGVELMADAFFKFPPWASNPGDDYTFADVYNTYYAQFHVNAINDVMINGASDQITHIAYRAYPQWLDPALDGWYVFPTSLFSGALTSLVRVKNNDYNPGGPDAFKFYTHLTIPDGDTFYTVLFPGGGNINGYYSLVDFSLRVRGASMGAYTGETSVAFDGGLGAYVFTPVTDFNPADWATTPSIDWQTQLLIS